MFTNNNNYNYKASRTINFRQNLKKTIEMVWTLPLNERQSLDKEDLPIDTERQKEEEERKTATIMEEPSDGLHEKQKNGRRYGRIKTSLTFGNGQLY